MARPPAGPPPVQTSAVARRDAELLQVRERNYNTLAHELRKENRLADLRAMLGSDGAVERFVAVVLHSFTTNDKLLTEADPLSVFQAVRDAASMGLEPTGIGGEGWILVYGKTATFIPGWQGYLKRIRNSDKVKHVMTDVVYSNDEFDYGRDETRGFWYTHHPAKFVRGNSDAEVEDITRGSYWGAFAQATLANGVSDGEVMDFLEIQKVANTFSASVKASKPSPWDTSWGEMARKTVLKRFAKRLPQEAIADLLAADERAQKLEEEEYGPGSEARVLDTSKARRAALAAMGAQRGEPVLIAPPRTPTDGGGGNGPTPQAPVGDDEWLAAEPPAQTVSDDDLPVTEEP